MLLLDGTSGARAWDVATGKLTGSIAKKGITKFHVAPHGRTAVSCRGQGSLSRRPPEPGDPRLVLWSMRWGMRLAVIDDTPASNVIFSRTGDRFVAIPRHWPDGGAARVFQRTRPEAWWGAAWLLEFWLTVALGAALIASLWRDRKIGASASSV